MLCISFEMNYKLQCACGHPENHHILLRIFQPSYSYAGYGEPVDDKVVTKGARELTSEEQKESSST